MSAIFEFSSVMNLRNIYFDNIAIYINKIKIITI